MILKRRLHRAFQRLLNKLKGLIQLSLLRIERNYIGLFNSTIPKRRTQGDILGTYLKPSLCIQEEDFDRLRVGRRTFIKTIPS